MRKARLLFVTVSLAPRFFNSKFFFLGFLLTCWAQRRNRGSPALLTDLETSRRE